MSMCRRGVFALLVVPSLLFTLPGAPASAAYQGQNGKILYVAGDDIYSINPDGTDAANLTNTPGLGVNAISASPDGKWVAFTTDSFDYGDESLFVIDLGGTVAYDVLAGQNDEFIAVEHPTWSPDGSRIAFEGYGYADFKNELYVVDVDGSDLEKLTNCDCVSSSYPAWSPVSNEIAFVPCCSGVLKAINADNRTIRDIYTREPGISYIDNITWSPDGTQLAFDDLIEVFRVPAAGGGTATPLTATGNGYYSNPAWSPDGQEIIVESNAQSDDQELYAIDAAQGVAGSLRRVTNILGAESLPDWAPLCTGKCTPTTLTVKVAKTNSQLKVSGLLTPAVPGQKVTVTLFKKTGNGFKKIKSIQPTVAADGTYKGTFSRPDAAKCKVEAEYAGDADHEGSTAVKTFSC